MATLSSTGRFAAGEACADNDILYGPYATTAAAHAALLNAEQNVVGRTVGIQTGNIIEEYWYQGGTEQANLVKKQSSDVEANPTGEATTPLNKIKIGDTNYNIPQTDTSNLATKQELQQGLSGKQDTISDLATIRSGAAAGATAYQKPSGGIPKTNLASDVQTSLGKADTAVQQVTVGTTTTGNAGTNASVTNSGTSTAPVFDFTIPRGADAVNPFKGWYDAAVTGEAGSLVITSETQNLPANPIVGDYAYVKTYNISGEAPTQTETPIAKIYECSTPGTWSDSGMLADTSNVQTFASGEEVNETYIDGTHLSNPVTNSLAKAADVTNEIYGEVSEIQVAKMPLANYYYKIRENTVDSNPYTGTGVYCCKIFVNEGDKFEIKGIGGTDQLLLYAICDSSLNILQNGKASINLNVRDTPLELTIGENGKYLFVNLSSYQEGDYVKQLAGKRSGGLDYEIEKKISKVEAIYEYAYTALSAVENYPKNCYLTKYGSESGSIDTTKVYKYPVVGGSTYYITGSTTDSGNCSLCSFQNANGELTTEGIIDSGVASARRSRYEIVAPSDAAYISIMQVNVESDYQAKCEIKTQTQTGSKDNQNIINSVGDTAQLETEDKSTLVAAINEVNAKIPDTPAPTPTDSKTIKILLVGSSHGMNTIAQLPWIAYKSGLDIEVGNVYIGSFSLQRLVGMNERSEKCTLEYFKDGVWTSYANKSFAEVFGYTNWDFISVQRSASDDTLWLTTQNEADTTQNSMTNINYGTQLSAVYMSHNEALQYVLNLIRNNATRQNCKVIFNSGFADPGEGIAQGTTENTSQTINIISTAKDMKEQFGIDYVPVAIAVRNARNTYLRHFGNYTDTSNLNGRNQLCYDSQHLDYGIGCYVASMCLLEFVSRQLGWGTINLKGYGTQAEVGSFISIALTDANYTEPTDETMIVAKACAMCACDMLDSTSTKLSNRFKWQIAYNLSNGITASNTKGYCGNLDTYSTTLSGTISSVVITSKPWDRTQPSTTLVEGTDYTYDSSTHKIVIGSVQGDITITAN